MAVGLIKYSRLLKMFIYYFVVTVDTLLHPLILKRIYETRRAFHFPRSFAPVSVIRFATLVFARVVIQCMATMLISGHFWNLANFGLI